MTRPATKPALSGFSHLPVLDGVRALAVGIVFVAHCGFESLIPGGLGVTIFFFLSGYLITSLLRSEVAQTGRVQLGAFYLRRTLRIWPPLYITLALSALATPLLPDRPTIDPWGVLAQLGFVINYAYLWGHEFGVPNQPLWSLAVEEHFYIVFPLLFGAVLGRLLSWRAASWCACACLLVLGLRLALAADSSNLYHIYYWSHTRIDSILFGCVLALWRNPVLDANVRPPRRSSVALALLFMLACLFVRSELFRQTFRYAIQGAALLVLFSWAIQHRGWLRALLGSPPMQLIGRYSYTIYLCHVMLIALIRPHLPGQSALLTIPIAGGATLLYSAAMYRFVEAPMARLRKRLHSVDAAVTEAPLLL